MMGNPAHAQPPQVTWPAARPEESSAGFVTLGTVTLSPGLEFCVLEHLGTCLR